MDRRQFRRRQRRCRRGARYATVVRRGRLSDPRHHLRQSVPARRRRRRGRAAAHGDARADRQAALRDRDQGRRRRSRSAGRFAAAAKPDGYTLLIHIVSISGFAEVDKLFGRKPKFTRADFIPIARLTAGPMVLRGQRPAALQVAQGTGRRRQEESRQADLLVVRALRRAASADRAVHEGRRHQDEAPADQWRRPGADRDPRQQFAGADLVDRRRQRPDEGRQAARACAVRRQTRGFRARRADAQGARLRRRILALGRRLRAQGHAASR